MILTIDNIHTYYGETHVLYDVSLQVGRGEVVSLLGPNGAGKTTTIRSILGLTPARSGKISFDDQDITRVPTHDIAKAGIGWVPDDRRIFPSLTVSRNLSIARKSSKFRSWDLREAFKLFSALEYLMDRECENLSGGELQMVSISRVLLGAPGLVLFDEPTQGLAPKVAQDVLSAVQLLKSEGISVLLVEHNALSALAVSDRVYIMDLGKIIYEGSAPGLLEDEGLRKKLLGA